PYPFEIPPTLPFQVDLRPTVRALLADLASGTTAAEVAGRLHETMARVVADGCQLVREAAGATTAALSGGRIQNHHLPERATERLEAAGFRVLRAREVPPNDGGIALGQAAIAAHALLRAARR